MTDDPHKHSYSWQRSGDDSVNRCSCGDVQATLKDAYKEPTPPPPPESRPRGRDY